MRFNRSVLAALAAGCAALTLAACETTAGPGYASGGGGGGTQLSRCGRQALIGAGVGALAGLATAPRGNRGENAAIGAAVGGAGTYGVCRWLTAHDQRLVEQSYQNSLAANQPYSNSWQSEAGTTQTVQVAQPAPYGANCRRVTATIRDSQHGSEQLPPETFCRNSSGQWVPA